MNSVYQPFYPKWYARLRLNSHFFKSSPSLRNYPFASVMFKSRYTLTNDAEASTDILKYTCQFFLI